jgi:hypothetical protein
MYLLDKVMNFFGFEKVKGAKVISWRIKRPTILVPRIKIPTQNNKKIQFIMNDLSTPDLIKEILPPVYTGRIAFAVKNYRGGGFLRNTIEGQAANCFVVVANTLNFFNSKSERAFARWAKASILNVYPRAGNDLNAYYDRSSLRFFSYSHPKIGGTIHTCDSSEIVAHELGHAILDTYRPETWNAALIEVDAFHEAFADFTAMIHALNYDEMINRALSETNNDLRKPNVISRIAEQFGIAIFQLFGSTNGKPYDCLRSAINSFVYVSPSTLPQDAPPDQLSSDPHNFSRIFLGAFYDIFVMMYEDNLNQGIAPIDAVKVSRDTLSTYVLKAVQNVPINAKFFSSMATTILWADVVLSNRKYHDRIHQIFVARNLAAPVLRMLSVAPACPDDLILKTATNMEIKLQDQILRAQTNNPLYNVTVEIPNEEAYLYDLNRMPYDLISVPQDESIQNACDMIDFLNAKNKVSDDSATPFAIIDGKLVRTHIS